MTDEARRQQALLAAIGFAPAPAHARALPGSPGASAVPASPSSAPAAADPDDAMAALLPFGLHERGTRAALGLAAYRANVEANTARALAAALPTVVLMVGEAGFARLARGFAAVAPPQRGDLGVWGDGFAEWLAAQPALAEWPYLADGAALDLAVHHCERAADAVMDAESLGLLASTDPALLRLLLTPGAALIESRFPVAAIHAAHRLDGAAADAAFVDVRAALEAGRGEAAFVVREAWKAAVHRLDAPSAAWTRSVLDGADLATALERAGAGFDFGAWLGAAVAGRWLKGCEAIGD